MSMNNQAMAINMEVAEREMRRTINFQSNMRAIEKEVADKQLCREAEETERRMNRRKNENWKRELIRDFLLRNIMCLVAAAVLVILDLFNQIDFVTVLVGAIFIGVYLSLAFVFFVESVYPTIITIHEEELE